jgi:lycopene cyclase domain-containing protein
MDDKLSYLLINILTVFFPVILSFDKKVHYYKKWKFILPGLFITGLLYLLWDYIFTIKQVWSFNDDYILGIRFFDLPLEEIMFFITIPFACIFIYECLVSYFKLELSTKFVNAITWLLIALCIILLILFYDRIYSLVNFSTLLVLLLYTVFTKTHLNMGKFYISYLVTLLPFYIVNGILTSIPIVMYNDAENMGFRVGTIPFEDHLYSMSLFLMNLLFFEFFRNKKQKA